jgi:hypothetical protein
MNPEKFNIQMNGIDSLFQSAHYEKAHTLSHTLRNEIEASLIVDGDMMGWAVYYELRALHALKKYEDYTLLMNQKEIYLVAIGHENHAFASSLMMEAMAYCGQGDDIPAWGVKTCLLRIKSNNPDALKVAINTTLALLKLAQKNNLRASFFSKLADVTKEEGLDKLHDAAQGWASAEISE